MEMDFGIAHLEHFTMTQDGAVLRTPSYMFPQQIRGDKVDDLPHIFSLAVIVHKMAAGNCPFLGRIAYHYFQSHFLKKIWKIVSGIVY